jgi:hypothetical protein
MTPEIRAKLEANHTVAAALTMLVGFEDRPECFGPVPSVEEMVQQLTASYKVSREAFLAEYERVTGEKLLKVWDIEGEGEACSDANWPATEIGFWRD